MKNIPIVFLLVLFVFAITGCGGKPSPQGQVVKGGNVVCILFNEKEFKKAVVEKVSKSLESRGYSVVSDRTKNANHYSPKDYAAIVYMAELWMWHTPGHAISYYKKHNRADNILFVITSGDPHVVIKKPFDAITSPSKVKDVDRVSDQIINRIETIVKK